MNNVLKIKNNNGKSADLLLYGDILNRESWWTDEEYITPQKVINELKEIGDVDTLNVRINSGGGDLFSAQAILSGLKRNKATVNVYVDGICASAATLIMMAGDKVIIPSNAMIMVHNPLANIYGNSDELKKMAETLDTVRESMIAAYLEKINISREELIELLDDETYLTAEQCVEMGFADEIETKEIAASISNNQLIMNGIKHDLNNFKQPDKLVAKFKNKSNKNKKGVKDNMFKTFETEKDFNNFLNQTKNDYKETLINDEEFVNGIRKGYISIEDVVDQFNGLELEGDNLEGIVNTVKDLKGNYQAEKENFENYKKEVAEDKLFTNRKAQMVNVGLEVEDEEKEEIINVSEKMFNKMIEAAKLNNKNKNDDGLNNFDPNVNIIDKNDDNDNKNDIANSLF